jgi:hypothetical protein
MTVITLLAILLTGPCKSNPAKTGLVDDPTLRANEVTLAAAVRSY